eukprot:m.68233 g.68233  ORF g.68233 m.68233 type:complete len:315 (+) comp13890_c0_seq1:239-1183(+)
MCAWWLWLWLWPWSPYLLRSAVRRWQNLLPGRCCACRRYSPTTSCCRPSARPCLAGQRCLTSQWSSLSAASRLHKLLPALTATFTLTCRAVPHHLPPSRLTLMPARVAMHISKTFCLATFGCAVASLTWSFPWQKCLLQTKSLPTLSTLTYGFSQLKKTKVQPKSPTSSKPSTPKAGLNRHRRWPAEPNTVIEQSFASPTVGHRQQSKVSSAIRGVIFRPSVMCTDFVCSRQPSDPRVFWKRAGEALRFKDGRLATPSKNANQQQRPVAAFGMGENQGTQHSMMNAFVHPCTNAHTPAPQTRQKGEQHHGRGPT